MQFLMLVTTFVALEATTKRLEMFSLLSDLFQAAGADEIDKIIYISQGHLRPPFYPLTSGPHVVGMSEKYLLRAIAKSAGLDPKEAERRYREMGDIGSAAKYYAELTADTRPAPDGLSVTEVYDTIDKIAALHGEGSVEEKIDATGRLFGAVSPIESQYIARFMAGKLRLGVGDATVLEALALKMEDRAHRAALERAYHMTSDLGGVARTLYGRGLVGVQGVGVCVGLPIRPALCERLSSAEEIIEKMGLCAVEIKYDGFRCQVHKGKEEVAIFSRNQERITPMFPEIADAMTRLFPNDEIILEGEALSFDETTGALRPFQETLQRKRKHDVTAAKASYPLKYFVFDCLYLNGTDYTPYGYAKRRSVLLKQIPQDPVIEVAEVIETDNARALADFFDRSVERGFEGIVAKKLGGPYTAGVRNFNWVKLKRSYRSAPSDSMDLCIVGYDAGRGSRAVFGIGTVLAAVYDPAGDRFKTVSKIGTGFSEDELARLKALLDADAVAERPAHVDSTYTPHVWVYPRYVISALADEITRSSHHTAGADAQGIGYALRFPRVRGFIREDKGAYDATTVDEIVTLYRRQRKIDTV